MLKIIKHGNTVHTYKCGRCGCIFIADNSEIKDDIIIYQLVQKMYMREEFLNVNTVKNNVYCKK